LTNVTDHFQEKSLNSPYRKIEQCEKYEKGELAVAPGFKNHSTVTKSELHTVQRL
jgi:hypothetical protein